MPIISRKCKTFLIIEQDPSREKTKEKMAFDFGAYARQHGWDVPPEHLQRLQESRLGVFAEMDDETIRAVLDKATLQNVTAGTPVFRQTDPRGGVGIHIILSGSFSVIHTLKEGEPGSDSYKVTDRHVAEDRRGVLLGDVESLVIGLTKEEIGSGEDGHALSTVICDEPGQLLMVSPDEFWAVQSYPLLRNVARLVAVKLLRRNAVSDAQALSRARFLVVDYLAALVRKHGTRPDLWRQESGDEKYLVLNGTVSQKQAAEALGISRSTINNLCCDGRGKNKKIGVLCENGLIWEWGHVIRMSAAFHEALLGPDPHALLTPGVVPVRQGGAASEASAPS